MIALHLDAPDTARLTTAYAPRVAALSFYSQTVASGVVDPLQAVADDIAIPVRAERIRQARPASGGVAA